MNHNASRIGTLILTVAVLAVLAVGLMLFGARLGLWEPIIGFRLVQNYMNPIAYCVIALGVVGLIYQLIMQNRSGIIKTGTSILLGVGLLTPMIYGQFQPQVHYPPIHDISTDTNNPPKFLVLDDNRPGAKNTLVYGGPEIAKQQKQMYPDIAPIQSNHSAPEAYAKALRVGKAMGWEIVAQDPINLRFEATARTPVYGFVDDVVVVVTPVANKSRLDIRSVSRVGRGDKGVNAARIREFVTAFER